jgi:molybdopterin/thiamine biosynthesis adenylyltransferase
MGGVGGVHVHALARLGVGAFNLTDFDCFELANFNRQAGAGISSIGKPKVEVMRNFAQDVNPSSDIRIFPGGLTKDNLGDYLHEVNVLIDGIDFFANDIRPALYKEAYKRHIPVICAAPLGAGAALIIFLPDGMQFEEYFNFSGCDDEIKAIHFLVGLSPRVPQRKYLAFPEIVDFIKRRVPSLGIGCQLASGIAATATLKLLIGRGEIKGAPNTFQFDAFLGRSYTCWRPGGNRNPLNRLTIAIVKKTLGL